MLSSHSRATLPLPQSALRGSQPIATRAFRSRRQYARAVRSVLEMGQAKASNGATSAAGHALDGAAAKEDMERVLQYRLVSSNPDDKKTYQALAWSVHNRLVEEFEKTDAFWK